MSISVDVGFTELLTFLIYAWTQLKSNLGEGIYILYFSLLAIFVGSISIFFISLETNRAKLRGLVTYEKIILSLFIGGPAAYPIFLIWKFADVLNIFEKHSWAFTIILVATIIFFSTAIFRRSIMRNITFRGMAGYTVVMILLTTALFFGLADAILVSMLLNILLYIPVLTALKLKCILVLGILLMAVPVVLMSDSAWCILNNKKNDMSDKIMAWLKSIFTTAYYKTLELLVRVKKRVIRKIT